MGGVSRAFDGGYAKFTWVPGDDDAAVEFARGVWGDVADGSWEFVSCFASGEGGEDVGEGWDGECWACCGSDREESWLQCCFDNEGCEASRVVEAERC